MLVRRYTAVKILYGVRQGKKFEDHCFVIPLANILFICFFAQEVLLVFYSSSALP